MAIPLLYFKPSYVLMNMTVVSKRDLFEKLAKAASLHIQAPAGIPACHIASLLLQREKLGSTECGRGIAIPHAIVPDLITPFIMLTRLASPLSYNHGPQSYVDLVGLLLVPSSIGSGAIRLLDQIRRTLQNPKIIQKIRYAQDSQSIFEVLTCPNPVAA